MDWLSDLLIDGMTRAQNGKEHERAQMVSFNVSWDRQNKTHPNEATFAFFSNVQTSFISRRADG